MEKINYLFEGWYSFNYQRGSQMGEMTHFQDGKLVGLIGDNNTGGPVGTQKLLLGYEKNGAIYFGKVAPGLRRGQDIMPVLWKLERKTDSSDLTGNYFGFFIFGGGIIPTWDLEIDMAARGIPSPEKFERITVEAIQSQLFLPILDSASEFATAEGCVGEIYLHRKI